MSAHTYSIIFCLPGYFSLCRLDDIVKTKDDSEYSRLSHYNKGLKLLKETLKSEKMQHKGERSMSVCMRLYSTFRDEQNMRYTHSGNR